MHSIKDIISTGTSYINNINPNKNFYDYDPLLTGIARNSIQDRNEYRTLIKFYNLRLCHIKSAFLYIFLEDAQSNARKVTISIKENKNNFDITSVTWANAPKVNNHHEICFDIYPRDINRYIKIDITPIVNNWTITKENFGLTIFDDSRCNNSLIKFSSLNSKKPPYLSICYDKDHKPCHNIKCRTGATGVGITGATGAQCSSIYGKFAITGTTGVNGTIGITGSVPLTSPFHTTNITFNENTTPTVITIPGGYIYSVSWSMTLKPNSNASFIRGDLNLNNTSISSMQFLTNSSSQDGVDLQNTTLFETTDTSTLILQYYAHKQQNQPTYVEIICATVNIFSICKL